MRCVRARGWRAAEQVLLIGQRAVERLSGSLAGGGGSGPRRGHYNKGYMAALGARSFLGGGNASIDPFSSVLRKRGTNSKSGFKLNGIASSDVNNDRRGKHK